jgi:hypothetical protein
MVLMSRLLAVLLAVILGATTLLACARPDPGNQAGSEADDSPDEVTVQPGTDPLAEGARADVDGLVCEEASGAWVASGTVANTTPSRRDYRIYVSFVDATGGTRAVRQADAADVEPDEQRRWQTVASLDGVGPIRCVLRVERFVSGGGETP